MGLSNRRREDHVRHHNDLPAHVGRDGVELVRKTVRSVLDNLTTHRFFYARYNNLTLYQFRLWRSM